MTILDSDFIIHYFGKKERISLYKRRNFIIIMLLKNNNKALPINNVLDVQVRQDRVSNSLNFSKLSINLEMN